MEFRKLLRDDGEESGAGTANEDRATGAVECLMETRPERLFSGGDESSTLLDFARESTFTSEPSSSGGATFVKDLRSSKVLRICKS